MKKLLLLIFVISWSCLHSQTLNLQWANSIKCHNNAKGAAVKADANGNVYTTGNFATLSDFDSGSGTHTISPVGQRDIFVLKNDASGNFVWAKSIGGNLEDISNSIDLDNSGNIYVTGNFQGTVDFDPGAAIYNLSSAGDYDAFLLKLDASGNFVWAKQIGGTGRDYSYSIKINAGSVYLAGLFDAIADFNSSAGSYTLSSFGSFDIFVAKFDLAGNFTWAKQMGGTASEQAKAIATDVSGNLYLTGNFNGTTNFDPGVSNYTITSATATVADIFVLKLDATGNFIWAKSMGGSGIDIGFSIATDQNNNVYTTGFYSGVSDFDPGSSTYTLSSLNNVSDVFISKLDMAGNFLWAKSVGGNSSDIGNSITTDALGNIYTTGMFQGTGDFDPGVPNNNLISNGGRDIFILKLDPAGNYVWSQSFGGSVDDLGNSIYSDASGTLFLTGNFGATVDFDPGTGIDTLYTDTYDNVYIVKLNQVTLGIKNNVLTKNIKIYPNPAQNFLRITIEAEQEFNALSIFNNLGQLVQKDEIVFMNKSAVVNTKDLSTGVYLLKLFNSGQTENTSTITKRIVIDR